MCLRFVFNDIFTKLFKSFLVNFQMWYWKDVFSHFPCVFVVQNREQDFWFPSSSPWRKVKSARVRNCQVAKPDVFFLNIFEWCHSSHLLLTQQAVEIQKMNPRDETRVMERAVFTIRVIFLQEILLTTRNTFYTGISNDGKLFCISKLRSNNAVNLQYIVVTKEFHWFWKLLRAHVPPLNVFFLLMKQ